MNKNWIPLSLGAFLISGLSLPAVADHQREWECAKAIASIPGRKDPNASFQYVNWEKKGKDGFVDYDEFEAVTIPVTDVRTPNGSVSGFYIFTQDQVYFQQTTSQSESKSVFDYLKISIRNQPPIYASVANPEKRGQAPETVVFYRDPNKAQTYRATQPSESMTPKTEGLFKKYLAERSHDVMADAQLAMNDKRKSAETPQSEREKKERLSRLTSLNLAPCQGLEDSGLKKAYASLSEAIGRMKQMHQAPKQPTKKEQDNSGNLAR